MNNKVAIYVRVSTLDQAEEGYSIGEQIDKLEKYCEIMSWTVSEIYTDAGFTGSNIDRPAMQQLIRDCKHNKFDTVLVYKLDRLSRSQKDTLYLIEDIFNVCNVGFMSLQEKFDTTTAFGKAMIGILSVFAQLEREQIKERMQLGKLGRARSGKSMAWINAAFGYANNRETGILEIAPLQATIVKEIYNDYMNGLSLSKLAKKLNNNGHIGKEKNWNQTAVKKVLSNPVYCGKITYNDNVFDGLHEPIITEDFFNAIQIELEKRQKQVLKSINQSRPFSAKYMLAGTLKCGYCGSPFENVLRMPKKGETYKKRVTQCMARYQRKVKGLVVYNNGEKCNSKYYVAEDLESRVIEQLAYFQVNPEALKNLIEENAEPIIDTSGFEKQLRNIENKIKKLSDLYMNDMITLDEMKEKSENLKTDKTVLENKISGANVHAPTDNFKIYQDYFGKKPIAELSYDEQKYIVNQLIDKIFIKDDEMEIKWKF